MAYYAELRRRRWYCINGMRSMVYIYRELLYNEWYNSLSCEDRQYLEEQKRKRKEKIDADYESMLQRLQFMSSLARRLSPHYAYIR